MDSSLISDRLRTIVNHIKFRAESVGRDPNSISLVAVSKKQSPEAMNLYLQAAQQVNVRPIFGENYIQEFRSKREFLRGTFESHLIGPLQSNKVRDAVDLFDMIQSVHSRKILECIQKESERIGKRQRILLQINISNDPQKSGFSPVELKKILEEVKNLSAISIEGLMAITALYEKPECARKDFAELSTLLKASLLEKPDGTPCELSMGMSADYLEAICEGSTMVRIGTALFGERA